MTKLGIVTLRVIATATSALVIAPQILAQDNATPNGVADDRNNAYAFTNATDEHLPIGFCLECTHVCIYQ